MAKFKSIYHMGRPGTTVCQFGYTGVAGDDGCGVFDITDPTLVEVEKKAKRMVLVEDDKKSDKPAAAPVAGKGKGKGKGKAEAVEVVEGMDETVGSDLPDGADTDDITL